MRALVVVDYQNDFVDGSLGSEAAALIEDAICLRMEDYLASGDSVLVTMDTHGDDYLDTLEGMKLPIRHCIKGTEGWQLHGRVREIAGREGCRILMKDTFGCAQLLGMLKDCDEIEICGVATNICVLANAVMARTANPQASITVRRDCVATYDGRLGDEALDVLAGLQVDVI